MQASDFDRSCPICSARQTTLLRLLRYALFDDLPLSGLTSIVVCMECGMVFNQLDGGANALNAYYQSNHHALISSTPGSGGLTEVELQRYQRLFKRLRLEQEQAKLIMDFGCGKGGWLEWLKHIGFSQLIGIEKSAACRESIQNCVLINVYAEVADLPENTWPQIVLLSHVLEHLYDPLTELRKLVDKSEKNAYFFIEVPNLPGMLDCDNPWSWLFFEHINHFDESSLCNLVRRAGLEVTQLGYWSFDPETGQEQECLYLVCRRATTEYRSEQKASDSALWSGRLNAMLTQRPLPDSLMASLDLKRPLALWGCSQYTMLVLGMHEEIRLNLRCLFDASSAKIGRRIAGIEIEHPMNLRNLTNDHLLLLPHSIYLDAMRKKLSDSGLYFDTLVF